MKCCRVSADSHLRGVLCLDTGAFLRGVFAVPVQYLPRVSCSPVCFTLIFFMAVSHTA